MINRKGPILPHDNVRPLITKKTLQKLKDLSSTDYHLIGDLANFLKDRVFRKREGTEIAFQVFINSWEPDYFKNGISKLVERLTVMCTFWWLLFR